MNEFDEKQELINEIEMIAEAEAKDIDEENAAMVLSNLFIKACTKYFKYLKQKNNWKMFVGKHNFCEFDCFFKKNETVVYVHISNYHFWPWRNVMCKHALHSNDKTGSDCNYCDIYYVEDLINILFERFDNVDNSANLQKAENIACQNCIWAISPFASFCAKCEKKTKEVLYEGKMCPLQEPFKK